MILKTKETYNNQVFLTTKVFSKLLYKTNFCNKKGNQILLGIDILKDEVQKELLEAGAKKVMCEVFGSQMATGCPFFAHA